MNKFEPKRLQCLSRIQKIHSHFLNRNPRQGDTNKIMSRYSSNLITSPKSRRGLILFSQQAQKVAAGLFFFKNKLKKLFWGNSNFRIGSLSYSRLILF